MSKLKFWKLGTKFENGILKNYLKIKVLKIGILKMKIKHIHSKFAWDYRLRITNNHAKHPSLSKYQLSVTDKDVYFKSAQIKIITR